VRLTVAEKREVIPLVEGSERSVRQTLQELRVNRANLLRLVSALPGGRRGGTGGQPCRRAPVLELLWPWRSNKG